jgi:Flp pilus assembly protein TadG
MRAPAKRTRGQGLIEFAMVIPILMLLLIGIVDMGRAWMAKNVMTGATREAARLAAVGNLGDAYNQGRAILASAGLNSAVLNITAAVNFGEPVTATASYNLRVTIAGFIPGVAGATIPISSTTTMRREYLN